MLTGVRSKPNLDQTWCDIILQKQIYAVDDIKQRFNQLVIYKKVNTGWEGP